MRLKLKSTKNCCELKIGVEIKSLSIMRLKQDTINPDIRKPAVEIKSLSIMRLKLVGFIIASAPEDKVEIKSLSIMRLKPIITMIDGWDESVGRNQKPLNYEIETRVSLSRWKAGNVQ